MKEVVIGRFIWALVTLSLLGLYCFFTLKYFPAVAYLVFSLVFTFFSVLLGSLAGEHYIRWRKIKGSKD